MFYCGVPHVQYLSLVLSHVSDRATNPLNRDTDWSSIHAFCDQLNSDLEGWGVFLVFFFFFDRVWFAVLWILTVVSYTNSRPQLATRLLAHKIQSPQEWEAMQALLVSLNLSQQMFYRQLLQWRVSLGLYMKLDMVDQALSFRSQHRFCCSLEAKWENRWSAKLQRWSTKQFLCDSPRLCSSWNVELSSLHAC